jgi:transcriptional regulator with XRE-family HTH domain
MTTKSPSLRQIAQELGVSHSLLSLWRQGKRTLKPEIEMKYWAFVTNSGYRFGDNPDSGIQRNTQTELYEMVPRGGLEPPTHGFSIHCSTN